MGAGFSDSTLETPFAFLYTLIIMDPDALLKLLKDDARLSDATLASRLSVSEAEVSACREALEREGRIMGYRVVTNDDDDSRVAAFIEVRCTPERGGGFNKLAKRVARFAEVKSCYLISGGYDLLVLLESSSLQEVARFVSEKLSSLDGVISTSTHFRLKTYKKDELLFDDEVTHERLHITP